MSKYRVFSGLYFPAFGPEKSRYLDTFHAVKDIYGEVCNDPGPLTRTIHKAIVTIRQRDDLNADAIKYFMVKDPKFARFYFLPKIHKRLHDVSGQPFISNCSYYTENISFFFRLSFATFDLGNKILHKRY